MIIKVTIECTLYLAPNKKLAMFMKTTKCTLVSKKVTTQSIIKLPCNEQYSYQQNLPVELVGIENEIGRASSGSIMWIIWESDGSASVGASAAGAQPSHSAASTSLGASVGGTGQAV